MRKNVLRISIWWLSIFLLNISLPYTGNKQTFHYISSIEIVLTFNMHIFVKQQFDVVSEKGSNRLLNDENVGLLSEHEEIFGNDVTVHR